MKKTIVFGLSVFLLWSCNNSEQNTTAETKKSHEHHEHEEDHSNHHYNESEDAITLNDGERWIVNEEMKPFVAQQEELLKTYISSNDTDYKTLANNLQEQNNLLIKSCTMTGKSHDELHKWLHPYIELLADLKAAESVDQAKQLISDAEASFETYHHYFQ